MITCTHPLYVNKDGDMIHSLGQLFHLSGDHFISTGSKFKSSHHLGADYKSQDPSVFPSHHWISVVLHGLIAVLDPGEQIYLLPKKKIPPDISIYFGAAATPAFQHFWYFFSCPFLREDFLLAVLPLSSFLWTRSIVKG